MLKFLALAGALCFLLVSCFVSQATGARLSPNKMLLQNWAWTEEIWTDSDVPYVAIKHNIDRAMAPLDLPAAAKLIQRYKAEALSNSKDPKMQFRWAYSVVAAARKAYVPTADDAADCSYALEKAVSPRNYEYARIRFLTAMQWGSYSALKGLGYRLIKKNPADLHVRYDFTRILVYGTDKERQQALSYAQSFVHRYPNWSGSYGLLGDVYQVMFFRTRKVAMGDKAIAAYLKSIQLAPADYDRRSTDYLIKIMRKWQKKWNQDGTAK